MRFIFILFISFISLLARDNPFFPTDPNKVQVTTSNRIEALPPYTTQTIVLPNSARAVKAIIIQFQNLDGSIANKTLEVNSKIDWHMPLVISQKTIAIKQKRAKKISKTISAKFIKFVPNKKTLRVITKDKMLRNFMLASPHRIVMDFSRDTSFRPKDFTVNKPPYKKIRMGNHDNYYRVVIELDGQYEYKLQTSEKDINIVCY